MMKIVNESHEEQIKERSRVMLRAIIMIINPNGRGVEVKISLILRVSMVKEIILVIILGGNR